MKKKLLCGLFIVTALQATDVALQAQDQDRQRTQDRDRTHVEDQGQAYGWQMMSEQERLEYHERMRTMHTEAGARAVPSRTPFAHAGAGAAERC